MKKTLKIITALILCISLLMIPMQVMAAPEEKATKPLYISEVKVGMGETSEMAAPEEKATKPLYISEVKVGMGETSEEAAKELLAEGFTIIKGNDGKYADLNEKAGTNSGMKKGPTDKIVYIGYKTTDDQKQAITDLAVMNMNGGYSVQDYEILMANHLEGEIKPFVDRFIAALNEYRENYKKPEDSLNYIKANYYRQMLNKLTDDDTGKALGDLLLNETKYEMGDDKYDALSDEEKKNHADILTLLLQGNGRAVFLLESLVIKAADSADDTWLDRFMNTEPEDLKNQIKKNNPSLTTEADIEAELDKTYYDTARKILEKWDEFSETIAEYDDNTNYLMNHTAVSDEGLTEKVKKIDTETMTAEDLQTMSEVVNVEADAVTTVAVGEDIAVVDYLSSTDYEDGTLLDFFNHDKSDFAGDGIRSLYPIAAALSDGQIAGLDFLSIKDLFVMALTNKESYQKINISEMMTASVFQDVDRQIYEPGGVALTNAALRAGAKMKDNDSDFMLSRLGFVFWGLTGVNGAATLISLGLYKNLAKAVERAEWFLEYNHNCLVVCKSCRVAEFKAEFDKKLLEYTNCTTKSNLAKYLTIGFTVVTALLAGYSIYITITEMLDYYQTIFTPIPHYIVDEADITQEINGKMVVINNQTAYYKVVPCNRKEGSSDVEKDNYRVLGTANDLNGDVGKQWLALYSVKYEFGFPILADSLKVVKGSDKLPSGYETGIHRFGGKPAFNLTSKYYCYNDDVKGTYVYFKHDKNTVAAIVMGAEKTATEKTILDYNAGENTTGSFFSSGSLALGAGVGLLLGAGIAVLILLPRLKKKKE